MSLIAAGGKAFAREQHPHRQVQTAASVEMVLIYIKLLCY